MPRSQNAIAEVNAGFLYEFDANDEKTVKSARIVYGGLSKDFVHANKTESFLKSKNIFDDKVLQEALKILEKEIVVEVIPGKLKPEYRKKAALGLFYKVSVKLNNSPSP